MLTAAEAVLADDAAVLAGVEVLLVELELHAAASRPAAASSTVPARRLLCLMALLGRYFRVFTGLARRQPLPDGTVGELVVAQRLLPQRRGEAGRGRCEVPAAGDPHRVGEVLVQVIDVLKDAIGAVSR